MFREIKPTAVLLRSNCVVSEGLHFQGLGRSSPFAAILAPSSSPSSTVRAHNANKNIIAVSYRSIYSSIEPPDARTVQNTKIYMKWYKASQSEGVSQPAPYARTKEEMQRHGVAVIRRSYWVGADIRQKTGYMQSCARMQSFTAKQVSSVSMPYLPPCGSLTLLLSHACKQVSDLISSTK